MIKDFPSYDSSFLDLPFFAGQHTELALQLEGFVKCAANIDHSDVMSACSALVRSLGQAGILRICVGDGITAIDSRSICLARERLAFHDGLADFAFAMQGLGSGAISLFATPALQQAILPAIRDGKWIAAFALSEKQSGSDAAALQCAAVRDGQFYVLNGEKTWISNGGIADVYTVFARTDAQGGARGISAFVVMADDPGFSVVEQIDVIAPHPLATIRFDNCHIPLSRRIGEEGEGFKIAMRTLDVFRASVAAAAIGFAKRALSEALNWATKRQMFGKTLADMQLTQAAFGDMATNIDAAVLLTYRAAWVRDIEQRSTNSEAAMAKMFATEMAQVVIDRALQMFGGLGVQCGMMVECLYRDIRALRIYEGATEVQKLIIARALLKQQAATNLDKQVV